MVPAHSCGREPLPLSLWIAHFPKYGFSWGGGEATWETLGLTQDWKVGILLAKWWLEPQLALHFQQFIALQQATMTPPPQVQNLRVEFLMNNIRT